MRRMNGSIIGPRITTSTSQAYGLWALSEAANRLSVTKWPQFIFSIQTLVVGGGGSGGFGRGAVPAGGGGAGGVFYSTNVQVTLSNTYTVGVGAATSRATGSGQRYTGNDSTFTGIICGTTKTITGLGGGGGGAPISCATGSLDNGLPGGSGGGGGNGGGGPYGAAVAKAGASTQSTQNSGICGTNYGNAGSAGTGGGGGAGGVGLSNNSGNMSGVRRGGIGYQFSINGTSTYYAGGGGAGTQCIGSLGGLGGGGAGGGYFGYPVACRDGTANTGGGGGAGGGSGNVTGGAGGSGVVIINYPINVGLAKATTGSPSQSYACSNTKIVYTFTSTGSISF